ncbi:hypothetical protein UFOVP1255_3 [uncultured Caudovirales phage]|uniref:Uncharacterized protein n=1 Tax=uncultured Caudovirales phage TaxID=2100421 RepID=A0A6J5RAB0_9CAUD|nr:hypothetical protein UFOVP973_23 [uncultured Caudovirales phage]CAB4194023.1 hypothetical protein UFOVP1255_3 [uncultured Caudovirales phage]CAB4216903.1 hypothetical protein UFOVP1496_20 [uncultured Caudovirales phage]
MQKNKAMLASWARAFLTAALTCYVTWGSLNWKMMLNSGIAALVPVILRWLNPKDAAFGRSVVAE